jgi:hypothetical protein
MRAIGTSFAWRAFSTRASLGEPEGGIRDTAFLLAGFLTVGTYFDRETKKEEEIRTLSHALYARADWQWAQNGALTVSHGWKPETGFIKYRWEGYSEALILYVLALGSPAHALPAESYTASTRTYRWKKLYELEFLYAGPLFIHQLSHLWIDKSCPTINDDWVSLARALGKFLTCQHDKAVSRKRYESHEVKTMKNPFFCWSSQTRFLPFRLDWTSFHPRKASFPFTLRF